MDAAVKFEDFIGAGVGIRLLFVESVGVGDIGEGVALDDGVVAFFGAEQGAGLADAFDDVVFEGDGFEIAAGVEAEKSVQSWGGSGSGDDVVVANFQVIEDLIDPDDAAARVVDQVVMEAGRAFRGGISKAGDEV